MSYFTLKNGENLYYETHGTGEKTIVMLHGWTTTHEVFEPVISEISKHARCIVYDHRGHGKSKDANSEHVTMDTLAEDLHEIILGLGLHDITLLGWSMGAGVVLNYTRLFGCEEIGRIILCDMTPRQMNDDDWKLGLYQGQYTKEDMERDSGEEFYKLYYKFATGAMPKLKKIPEVIECHATTGAMDLFIKMYARNNHNLMEIIHDRLQPLGLSRSETIISFSTDIDRQLPILDDFEEEEYDLDDDEDED